MPRVPLRPYILLGTFLLRNLMCMEFHDNDDIFSKEKELADSFPVRRTDVEVIEYSNKIRVRSYVIVPCVVCEFSLVLWCRPGMLTI
jgi:hypothetical protein